MIIHRSINVNPRVVEEVLQSHESVDQAVVLGLPHKFYGEEVVAVIKLKANYTMDIARPALGAICKKTLSVMALPTTFIEIKEFPTSTTGKVQLNKLREIVSG